MFPPSPPSIPMAPGGDLVAMDQPAEAAFPVFRRDADSPPGWRRLRERVILDNPYVRVEQIEFQSPGHPAGGVEWTVARRKNAVIVAPRLADGRYLLIHQERYPIQRTLWEFPAGQIDEPGRAAEPAVIAATVARELAEETGHRLDPQAGRLVPLGYYFSSQGFTDEHGYLFLADGVVPGPAAGPLGEGDERIHEARAFTSAEVEGMIAAGEIVDANTLAAYARLKARRLW
jgi:ADP-ribose pyrophosphatase